MLHTLAAALLVLPPQTARTAEYTEPPTTPCEAASDTVATARLRAPNGRAVGRITLTYSPADPTGFCGRVHIKKRYATWGQVRYQTTGHDPNGYGGTLGASEPARDPHPVGVLCACDTSGATATYVVTFIQDFYRPGGPDWRAQAEVNAVVP